MKRSNVVLLLILGVFWGSAFLFMKVLAPVFGAILSTGFRMIIGGIFVFIYILFKKEKLNIRKNIGKYLMIGIINTAIPIMIFTAGALYLDASMLVVITAVAPLFGAVFGAIFLKESFRLRKIIGVLLGIVGVSIVSSVASAPGSSFMILPIIFCVIATSFYGIGGLLIRLKCKDVGTNELAFGSQFFGGLVILPLVFLTASSINIPSGSSLMMMIFLLIVYGALNTGVAFIIYFKILREEGMTKALTVTLITPVFGIIWAYLFLGEAISGNFVIGSIIVILSASLIIFEENRDEGTDIPLEEEEIVKVIE